MTDNQKEAIERMYDLIHTCDVGIEKHGAYDDLFQKDKEAIETVLNLIQTQQAEIEHQKEKRENQKKELSILYEKQKEFNKLVNTVKSYKGQFERQQAEIEKKDRQLEERTNRIRNLEKECQSNFDNMMDTIQDNSKKDKMIEYMANFINDNTPYTKDTRILENERGVRNTKYTEKYFERKSENEN